MKSWSRYADKDGAVLVINYPRIMLDVMEYKDLIDQAIERRRYVRSQLQWYKSKWDKVIGLLKRIFT